MKTDNDGLHLIGKGEKEAHAHIGPEFPEPQGGIGVLFFCNLGVFQYGNFVNKCSSRKIKEQSFKCKKRFENEIKQFLTF